MAFGGINAVTAVLLADTKEYSAKLDEAGAKMEAFGAQTATTGEKVAGAWGKMSTLILGAGVAVAAVSVDLAYKYNEALDTMQRTTHLTGSQMDYLKGQILNVSTATATSADLITTGETQLIKSGESVKQSLRDVAQAAKYAQATGGDFNATLTSAIGIQKQHIAGTHSITQSLNIMDTAIKNSQLTADELNTALSGKSLSTFSAYHVDLRTATTLLAGFADENLTGTKALMALKGGYTALDAPVKSTTGTISQSAATLTSLKLSQSTLAAEARKPGGMLQVLTQINQAFDQNANSQQKALGLASVMQQIFGTSAGPAYTNLIKELPQLTTLYDKINHSSGSVNSSFSEFLHSPAGAVAQFKTALENAAIRIGDVILPKLTVGLMDVTHLVTGISKSKDDQALLGTALEGLFGAAVATKLIPTIIKAAQGLGVGGDVVAGAGAAEIAVTAAGGGIVAGTGIVAFEGTLELLKHNFLGLGNAVNYLTNHNILGLGDALDDLAGWLGKQQTGFQGTDKGYGKNLAAELAKVHITDQATISLSPATLEYLDHTGPYAPGNKSKHKGGKTTVNLKASTKLH